MISKIDLKNIRKRVAFIYHPFFILLFFFPQLLTASFLFTPANEAAYQDFLNLRINSGQRILQQALKEDPKNGISIYLANYSDAIKIFLTEDEVLYKQLSKNEGIRIKKLQALDKKSPYYLFTQAEVKLHWAFVKLKMGDEVNAMLNIRSSYKLLEENSKLYPDFIPNKKTMGLLHILIGSIPSNYNWVLSLVGMEGNIQTGLKLLNEVCSNNNPYKLEALIIKTVVQNYIVHAYTGKIEEAKQLYNTYPENLLVCYLYAAILTKNSRGDEAYSIIEKRPVDKEIIYFPHVDLLLGELHIYKGEYANGRMHYLNFIKYYKGKNSLKDTYYKLFLTHWLSNEDQLAMPYFEKILTVGKTLYDSDKFAQRVAENREIPNKEITKIRLYTDGGYYPLAFDLLKSLTLGQFHTKRDKLEYLYRSARLFHKAEQFNDAILYYKKTIELSSEDTYYFAPNSCLQLGYIYQSREEKVEASRYFNLALGYKNYDYKNSIDNKAKAALNELR